MIRVRCDYTGDSSFQVIKYNLINKVLNEKGLLERYLSNENKFFNYIIRKYRVSYCKLSNRNEYKNYNEKEGLIKDINHIIEYFLPNSVLVYFLRKKA